MTFSDDIKQKKQSIHFYKWIYIFVITLIVLSGAYYFFGSDKEESISISNAYTVGKGDLKLYVSGEGKVISGKKIEVNFPVSGIITGIYKNEGEGITTGEKIASLNDDIYKLNLEKANINLKNSYAKLEGIKETVSNSELKVLEKSLELAKENYDNTKLKLSSTLDSEKNSFNSLVIQRTNLINDIKIEKSNLELIITDENKKIENLEKTLDFKGNILILDIDKYLNKIDELVGITPLNKDANDSFEDYLGAKDSNLKTKIISDFTILNNNLLKNKELLNSNNDLLISYSSELKNLLNQTIELISNSIETTSFTITEIQNHKSDFRVYLSALELNHQAFSLAYDTLDYEKTNKDILIQKQNNLIEGLIGDLELVNKDVNNYSNKLSNLEKTNEGELVIAQKQLEKTNLEYNNSIAGPTSTVLKPYYIDIEDAESRVKEAKKNLSDTVLNSPVNGTVLDINYRTGEYYGTKQESFGVIISVDGKYIESYIEERDIANIKLGQVVDITVDAFEDYSFTGVVNYVSTLGEEDKDEVIKYKVLISFDDDNERLRDSMSVSLDFLHEKLEDIILIPSEYIIYKDGISNIILADGTYRVVVEGNSDGEYTQIISGLEVGEKIGLIKE